MQSHHHFIPLAHTQFFLALFMALLKENSLLPELLRPSQVFGSQLCPYCLRPSPHPLVIICFGQSLSLLILDLLLFNKEQNTAF